MDQDRSCPGNRTAQEWIAHLLQLVNHINIQVERDAVLVSAPVFNTKRWLELRRRITEVAKGTVPPNAPQSLNGGPTYYSRIGWDPITRMYYPE